MLGDFLMADKSGVTIQIGNLICSIARDGVPFVQLCLLLGLQDQAPLRVLSFLTLSSSSPLGSWSFTYIHSEISESLLCARLIARVTNNPNMWPKSS